MWSPWPPPGPAADELAAQIQRLLLDSSEVSDWHVRCNTLGRRIQMLKGFRDFLLRGNVIDLAIAVVIGTAFTEVVATVTGSILRPLINIFLGGGVSGGKVIWREQVFDFGAVINAALTFVIIAAVVYFLVVLPMRRLTRTLETPAKPEPAETKLLTQIRDLLARQVPTH
jgi:large conductance mechanosensitive channel